MYGGAGFPQLQAVADDALIALKRHGGDPDSCTSADTRENFAAQEMPLPQSMSEFFQTALKNIGGLYLVIGFNPVMTRLIIALVQEKEKRVKETVKIMGMPSTLLNVGWVISTALVNMPVTLGVALGASQLFYQDTSFVVVLLLFVVYVFSIILASFVFVPFFKSEDAASNFAGLINLVMFLPYYAVNNTTGFWASLANLSSPIAFSSALNAISELETSQGYCSLSNMFYQTPSMATSVGSALLWMLVDICLYILLGWYLEAVVQGAFGLAKHPCFCFLGLCKRKDGYGRLDGDMAAELAYPLTSSAVEGNDDRFEAVEISSAPVVVISHLSKVFEKAPEKAKEQKAGSPASDSAHTPSVSSSQFLAVNDLSLSLYEGQTLALLGHNGAGKSTLIGMLSGLYKPSAGSVSMYGMDLATDTDAIHDMMGVCPQHDVLFDHLTVEEHLTFYAKLKYKDWSEEQVRTHVV
jgi:ABC-type multidrug transport system fused ATPase/permease subunit